MFFIAVAVAIVIAAYNWHFNLYETAVSFDGSLTLEWMNNIRKCCDGFFLGMVTHMVVIIIMLVWPCDAFWKLKLQLFLLDLLIFSHLIFKLFHHYLTTPMKFSQKLLFYIFKALKFFTNNFIPLELATHSLLTKMVSYATLKLSSDYIQSHSQPLSLLLNYKNFKWASIYGKSPWEL